METYDFGIKTIYTPGAINILKPWERNLMIQTGMCSISIKSELISVLLLVLINLPGFGQVSQFDRYELLLKPELENPRVASVGKDGALIYRRVRDKKNDFIELIKVDTSLHENWHGAIAIDNNLGIVKVIAYEHTVYLLLHSIAYGGFDLTVVALNVITQNYNTYVVKNLIPLKTTEFKASKDALLIGGYFNDIPVVLHYSLATNRSRLLPGFFNDPGELNEIKIYEDGLTDIIVSTKNIQRKRVLWIRSYSSDGDLINASVLQDTDRNLLSGKSFRKVDGTLIVAGNFSLRNVDYSKGIFNTEINLSEENTIRYHNFSDLQNFFKYMKPSRESRVKDRIEQRKQKGKKVRYTYQFLTQEVKQYGNEYVLLGEAYYPRYYYLSSFGYSMRGDRIFDGYRYTHAVVIGFNEKGDLAWDNIFEINDVKPFNIQQFVKLAPEQDKMGMLYLYENKLWSKTIFRNEVLEGKAPNELRLKHDYDVVRERNTEGSRLEYWYDPFFLIYGIQNVSNSRNERDESGRRVLFINKLKFE
jgi:hypothetical protein